MSKTVEVLLSRRVTIGIGEAAGDHLAGSIVTVSEDVAQSIIGQNAGSIVVAEKPSKKQTAAEKAAADQAAADQAAADAQAAAGNDQTNG